MKFTISIFLLFFLSTSILAQNIGSLKTDSDCLKLIRNNIPDLKDFHFDSIFTKEEMSKLKGQIKNWAKFDFNNDKKSDLLFMGRQRADWTNSPTVYLYLSDGDSYKLIYLLRRFNTFRPAIYLTRKNGKKLLVIHLYDSGKFKRVDELLKENRFSYPDAIRGNDTLINANNSIINYASRPTNIGFDSLIYKTNWGGSYRGDSFIVYNDGAVKYFDRYYEPKYTEKQFQLTWEDLGKLKTLIKGIDTTQASASYSQGGTDGSSATLLIFDKAKKISFFDYGMESTFTLMAIYKLFGKIRPGLF